MPRRRKSGRSCHRLASLSLTVDFMFYMFSIMPALIALWNPMLPWPYSDSAPSGLYLYWLGPSPAESACAIAACTVWFCAGKKMTLELAVLAIACIASRYLEECQSWFERSMRWKKSYSPNLHSRSRRENVGGLAHQLRALDLGARGDDLGLSRPLGLRGHRQRILELLAEDDVLNKHRLNLHTPASCGFLNYFPDRLRDFLPAFNHILEHASANDMAQGGLGALNESLADIADAEGRLVWRSDAIVDHGSKIQGDVVFCHADLLRNFYSRALAIITSARSPNLK